MILLCVTIKQFSVEFTSKFASRLRTIFRLKNNSCFSPIFEVVLHLLLYLFVCYLKKKSKFSSFVLILDFKALICYYPDLQTNKIKIRSCYILKTSRFLFTQRKYIISFLLRTWMLKWKLERLWKMEK